MSKLLTHHVSTLRLNPHAPFPRHCSDVKDMIKQERELRREYGKRGDTAQILQWKKKK